MKREKLIFIFGVVLLICGVLLNEYTLSFIFSRDGMLEKESLVLIRIFDIVVVVAGILSIVFRKSKVMVNLYVLGVVLFVLLGAVEIVLRIPGWKKSGQFPLKCKDEYLHHSLRKNTTANNIWGDREVVYHTNSLGYRDLSQRVVNKKTSAKKRILFLGDSYTQGSGVIYEDHFIFKLGSLINSDPENVEILNAGVSSYCPSLEYRKLKQFLDLGYTTDEVVLMFDISDIHDEAVQYVNWEKTGPEDPFIGSLDVYPMILREFQARLSQIIKIDSLKPRDRGKFKYRYNWTEYDEYPAPWVEEGIRICKENILKIVSLCHENSIKFSMVIYPQPTQLKSTRRPSKPQTIFTQFATDKFIVLYDIFPNFFALDKWNKYFIPGDIHWNPEGHTFVAQLLYEKMQSSKNGK